VGLLKLEKKMNYTFLKRLDKLIVVIPNGIMQQEEAPRLCDRGAFWRASHSVAMVDACKFWHHGAAIVMHQVLPSRKCARDGSMSTALMHAVQPREELPPLGAAPHPHTACHCISRVPFYLSQVKHHLNRRKQHDIIKAKRIKAGELESMDDFTKKRIQKIMDHYTENAVSEHVKSQIKIGYKIRGNHVTLIEERQAFQSDRWVQLPVAQFRLDEKAWKVYWQDSKGKWHFIDDIEQNEDFETQLKIVDEGHNGMFWG